MHGVFCIQPVGIATPTVPSTSNYSVGQVDTTPPEQGGIGGWRYRCVAVCKLINAITTCIGKHLAIHVTTPSAGILCIATCNKA